MTMAAQGATNPAAGVIPTSPATSPEATPSAVGLPRCAHSTTSQAAAPAAAAMWVSTSASAARPLDAERAAGVEAEPAEPEDARAESASW